MFLSLLSNSKTERAMLSHSLYYSCDISVLLPRNYRASKCCHSSAILVPDNLLVPHMFLCPNQSVIHPLKSLPWRGVGGNWRSLTSSFIHHFCRLVSLLQTCLISTTQTCYIKQTSNECKRINVKFSI